MELNTILLVIFGAAALVGGAGLLYQIYQMTVLDAKARGLKHPRLWGLLSANGNGSGFLILYLIGRRSYPVQSMSPAYQSALEKRKKSAGACLIFLAAGTIGIVLSQTLL